jgi:hypothetical protein
MMTYSYLYKQNTYYKLPNHIFFIYIWQIIRNYKLPNRVFFAYIWQIINTVKVKISCEKILKII